MKLNLSIDNNSLIEECRKGNKEALNLFYTRFAPKMLGVIRRYVPNLNDAEDILHDGFIVALTRLDSLRDGSKVEFWLASIMRNLSLKFLENQDLSAVLEDLQEIDDTPELEDIIDLETLEKLICKLPEGYQKVFRLAVLENKSHKEIGAMLGISPGTSSSQLFHARVLMRKLIGDYKRGATLLSLLIILIVCGGLLLEYNINTADSIQPSQPIDYQLSESIKNKYLDNNTEEESLISKQTQPTSTSLLASAIQVKCSHYVNSPSVVEGEGGEIIAGKEDNSGDNNTTEASNSETVKPQPPQKETSSRKAISDIESEPAFKYTIQLTSIKRDMAVGFSVNPGLIASTSFLRDFSDSSLGSDPIYSNPSHGEENKGDDKEKSIKPATRSESTPVDYGYISHHNHFPVRISASFRKQLTDKWSVEGDLNYSYLHTTFNRFSSVDEARWHYVGISAKVNFKSFTSGRFQFYGSGGISFDIPVNSRVECSNRSDNFAPVSKSFKAYSVWTLSASYGVEFKISEKVGIFVEPTLDYHIQPSPLVPNYWTDNPTSFSLPFGLRFSW